MVRYCTYIKSRTNGMSCEGTGGVQHDPKNSGLSLLGKSREKFGILAMPGRILRGSYE